MKLSLIRQTRTNNFDDPEMMNKIQELWKQASQQLHDPAACTYGVYFDYASDYRGDYSLGVAVEAKDVADTPHSLIDIPASAAYQIFKVDAQDELGVVKAWQKVWEQEGAGQLKRAYTVDYEKYNADSTIEIYIAVQ
ncbi:GyrI-like domain-containing protein [Paenibacillus sp. GCM10027626]|uniref:GyrI-like domain-containing protein n=1 Tax=Paenibacillus sp. GCM10027626 TaxID=3273411 RepID=UPI0036276F2B